MATQADPSLYRVHGAVLRNTPTLTPTCALSVVPYPRQPSVATPPPAPRTLKRTASTGGDPARGRLKVTPTFLDVTSGNTFSVLSVGRIVASVHGWTTCVV